MSPHYFLNSKIVRIFLTFGCLLMGTLHATCEIDERCNISHLQVGANYTHATIKVGDQPTFNGNLGGLQGSYEYRSWNGFYAGLNLTWKQGETKNHFADRKLVYVDVQERIGYTYASCCYDWSMTFFSGFGYRYLNHQLKQYEESLIEFDYNEFYVPIGFLSEYSFCRCWSIGFNLTWMPQVYPTVEIAPLKGARWILKNSVGNVLLELPLAYLLKENCYSLILKPFYQRWEDGRSTAKTTDGQELGLPRNSYNFWGIELNFSFLF